jgi:hypothetical protein
MRKLWLDQPRQHLGDIDPLAECEFWDSPSRRRYHAVTAPRISKLSSECTKIYEYETYSDAGDNNVMDEIDDDEYCES